MSDATFSAVFEAGKASAKADVSKRDINERAVKAIQLLGLTLGDKDKIEQLRYEYVTGALVGGRKYSESRARFLADGKNAKERNDDDKVVLNDAGVNWLRVRVRAGLKAPAKPKEPKAPAAAPEAANLQDITIVPVSDTQALLGLFSACHAALLKTINASGTAIQGDAASILRAALVDLGNACEDAAMSLATDVSEGEKRELIAA